MRHHAVLKSIGLAAALVGLAACEDQPKRSLASATSEPFQVRSIANLTVMPAATMTVVSRISLTPETSEALREFGAGSGYGAFFVRRNGAGWGWFSDMFNAKDARRAAQVRCDAETGTRCVLYATLAPSRAHGPGAVPSAFSDLVQEAKRRNDPGEFAAFATAGLGNVGVSWGYSNPKRAGEEALRQCEREAEKTLETASVTVTAAFRRTGMDACRVVAVFR